MKYIYIILALIFSGSALADAILYSDDESQIKITKSKEISSIENDGKYISFSLDSERFFTLTAFSLKQTSPSKYPNASGLNEAFSNSRASAKEKYAVLEKSDISITFKNKEIMGSLYITNYSGSTRMLCDMNFIHPVGNKYYWIMTLTTASEECTNQRESLMKSLRNVFQSISVGDNLTNLSS